MEERPTRYLENALRNIMFYLAPKGWGLLIIHSTGGWAGKRKEREGGG